MEDLATSETGLVLEDVPQFYGDCSQHDFQVRLSWLSWSCQAFKNRSRDWYEKRVASLSLLHDRQVRSWWVGFRAPQETRPVYLQPHRDTYHQTRALTPPDATALPFAAGTSLATRLLNFIVTSIWGLGFGTGVKGTWGSLRGHDAPGEQLPHHLRQLRACGPSSRPRAV